MNDDSKRDYWLGLNDEELQALCCLDFYKATGPGGQKRNKTESAARFTHKPTGLAATACDSRQQSVNRTHALRQLRFVLACELRQPASQWTGSWQLNAKNPLYPQLVAKVLDALEEQQYQVSSAAEFLGLSTGKLIKFLAAHDPLWQRVNQQRQRLGHKPLKKK